MQVCALQDLWVVHGAAVEGRSGSAAGSGGSGCPEA